MAGAEEPHSEGNRSQRDFRVNTIIVAQHLDNSTRYRRYTLSGLLV